MLCISKIELRYVDAFAGVGGFRLGIERAFNSQRPPISQESQPQECGQGRERSASEPGALLLPGQFTSSRCVSTIEWDKHCCQIYSKNFGESVNPTDITKVNPSELPDFDLFCGGFPCQSFSIAGKRRGFEDTRGTMFFEIARIIEVKRPSYLLLENVKGLLNHEQGKTFSVIIQTLDELGYDVQWMVLNSKFFGVPQNRERVFIIGSLRGQPRPEVLPFREDDQEPDRTSIKTSGEGERFWNYPANTISKMDYKGGNQLVMRFPLKYPNRNQKQIKGDYSFTVDSVHTGGIKQGIKIRRLTPIECERLQGFPDNWTQGVSDTQRYKMMGNAVTVNVIENVIKRIFPDTNQSPQKPSAEKEKDCTLFLPDTNKCLDVSKVNGESRKGEVVK